MLLFASSSFFFHPFQIYSPTNKIPWKGCGIIENSNYTRETPFRNAGYETQIEYLAQVFARSSKGLLTRFHDFLPNRFVERRKVFLQKSLDIRQAAGFYFCNDSNSVKIFNFKSTKNLSSRNVPSGLSFELCFLLLRLVFHRIITSIVDYLLFLKVLDIKFGSLTGFERRLLFFDFNRILDI